MLILAIECLKLLFLHQHIICFAWFACHVHIVLFIILQPLILSRRASHSRNTVELVMMEMRNENRMSKVVIVMNNMQLEIGNQSFKSPIYALPCTSL